MAAQFLSWLGLCTEIITIYTQRKKIKRLIKIIVTETDKMYLNKYSGSTLCKVGESETEKYISVAYDLVNKHKLPSRVSIDCKSEAF